MLNMKALLAGIFAVAVGAGIVYYSREKAPLPEAAPTPIVVAQQPFEGPRSKAEARAALAALPELKAWSEHLETSSGGASHGALIEYGPTPKVIGEHSYWQFSYVENTPDASHRWDSFLVGKDTPEILVEDDETDRPIGLEQWRKEKQPMARKSALY
jgi:hypothetical protein